MVNKITELPPPLSYVAQEDLRLPDDFAVPHTLAGFRGAFISCFGRKPSEQEIWNAAIRSWRDLNGELKTGVPDKVQAEYIESLIERVDYTYYSTLVLAVVTLKNGAIFTGESRPVSASLFQLEEGQKRARADALSKIYQCEAYMLRVKRNALGMS